MYTFSFTVPNRHKQFRRAKLLWESWLGALPPEQGVFRNQQSANRINGFLPLNLEWVLPSASVAIGIRLSCSKTTCIGFLIVKNNHKFRDVVSGIHIVEYNYSNWLVISVINAEILILVIRNGTPEARSCLWI